MVSSCVSFLNNEIYVENLFEYRYEVEEIKSVLRTYLLPDIFLQLSFVPFFEAYITGFSIADGNIRHSLLTADFSGARVSKQKLHVFLSFNGIKDLLRSFVK